MSPALMGQIVQDIRLAQNSCYSKNKRTLQIQCQKYVPIYRASFFDTKKSEKNNDINKIWGQFYRYKKNRKKTIDTKGNEKENEKGHHTVSQQPNKT